MEMSRGSSVIVEGVKSWKGRESLDGEGAGESAGCAGNGARC